MTTSQGTTIFCCWRAPRHILVSNGVAYGLCVLLFPLGLAVSGFLREQGIPCSLYIDDRLNGGLLTKSDLWSILYSDRREEFRVKAATAAIFIVLSVLVELGYTIGISKSVLYPTTSLE